MVGRLPDGSWLGLRPTVGGPGPQPAGRYVDSLTLLRVSAAGDSTVPLNAHPGMVRSGGGGEFGPLQEGFGIRGVVVAGAGGYCFGDGARYDVGCYTAEGALDRLIRRAADPAPVTALAIDRYKAWLTGMRLEPGMAGGDAMRERMRRLADATQFASTFPFFRGFQLDPLGFVWVNNYDLEDDMPNVVDPRSLPTRQTPDTWSVFDPSGRWMGDVRLPAGFRPVGFDRDVIVGMGHDADTFQQVLLLRLDRR